MCQRNRVGGVCGDMRTWGLQPLPVSLAQNAMSWGTRQHCGCGKIRHGRAISCVMITQGGICFKGVEGANTGSLVATFSIG